MGEYPTTAVDKSMEGSIAWQPWQRHRAWRKEMSLPIRDFLPDHVL